MSGLHGFALIGDSTPMRILRSAIAFAAPTRLSVLIQGPTGSGKELVAAALHVQSGRKGPFVPFNVCAIGDAMFEDALFGHVRGAYTGAFSDSAGYLREADGGTAFFDEITGLHAMLQPKLLRAIETGEFRPIGAGRDAHSDFRVVAATNERLGDLVANGRFRADLAHRLGGITIHVPSLDERRDDIPLLLRHFLDQFGRSDLVATPGAIQLLQAKSWPGNVREFQHAAECAAAIATSYVDEGVIEHALALRGIPTIGPVGSAGAEDGLELRQLLESCRWNKEEAAEALGIHVATLYRRIKRHRISGPARRYGRGRDHPMN
jgi:DNA-binding NtrC family response regulator